VAKANAGGRALVEEYEHREPPRAGRADASGVGVAGEEGPTASQPEPTLRPLVIRYIAERRNRGEIEPITARSIRNHLYGFADSFGRRHLANMGRSDVERWLTTIAGLAPSSKRCYYGSVNGFLIWLVETKRIRTHPMPRRPKVRQPRRVPRAIEPHEVALLFQACRDARERMIIALMVFLGLRCIEVSRLQVGDWSRTAGTLTVFGKGGHERVLPVPDAARAAITAYLAEDPPDRRQTRGVPQPQKFAGPLLRNHEQPHAHLSAGRISNLVGQLFARAGVKGSAHALRSTCASDVLDQCGDLTVVQEMLGHSNLQNTSIYLRRARIIDLRTAMEGRTYRPGEERAEPTPIGKRGAIGERLARLIARPGGRAIVEQLLTEAERQLDERDAG
jgi:site-specific recombinase XerD